MKRSISKVNLNNKVREMFILNRMSRVRKMVSNHQKKNLKNKSNN